MSAELRSSAVEGIGENSFAHRRFSYVTEPFIPPPASQSRSVLTFDTILTFISRTCFVMFPFFDECCAKSRSQRFLVCYAAAGLRRTSS